MLPPPKSGAACGLETPASPCGRMANRSSKPAARPPTVVSSSATRLATALAPGRIRRRHFERRYLTSAKTASTSSTAPSSQTIAIPPIIQPMPDPFIMSFIILGSFQR